MTHLSSIKSPEDVRHCTYEQCEELSDDIRQKIIQTVAQNGGHLSSNLGMVEITLALHRVFHSPVDKFIFDVGHQSYVHKLITGRYEQFHTLRTYKGISGFPMRSESEHDIFEVGHASTAISAALGMARARDLQQQSHHIVAIVGDGAFTGGMCYEALNDCGNTNTRLIVLLNDNEMSIAKNVGALSKYLSNLRASTGWHSAKKQVKNGLGKIPFIGKPIAKLVKGLKVMVKSFFVDDGFFDALGFQYLGPIDGHDQRALEKVLIQAKNLDIPVVVHCVTKKGYGYFGAESKPEKFHGTLPFYIESGKTQSTGKLSNGNIASQKLVQLAKTNDKIHVITAAMPLGTGTNIFSEVYPSKFSDVGIAEEHAVTLSAGMAIAGMKPYVFIYSTFMQRAYDQVLNDVCIQKLPVVFMLDRSGITNEDGQSHQGLFDITYLRSIPNMTVLAPTTYHELQSMIDMTITFNSPCAIRYPKSFEELPEKFSVEKYEFGKWQQLTEGENGYILATGSMLAASLRVYEHFHKEGITFSVVNASTIKPLDEKFLVDCYYRNIPIYTIEEQVEQGGFGSSILEHASNNGYCGRIIVMGVPDRFVQHGDRAHLLDDVGLSDEHIIDIIKDSMNTHGGSHVK